MPTMENERPDIHEHHEDFKRKKSSQQKDVVDAESGQGLEG